MKRLSKYINESLNEDAKDDMRINDIITKSAGNDSKALQLAQQMAKSITDKAKALRRYQSALNILGADHGVTRIFASRASELGNSIEGVQSVQKPIKFLGSDINLNSGRSSRGGTPSPILPIGTVNVLTGSSKYFNIYDTWRNDGKYSSVAEIWADFDSANVNELGNATTSELIQLAKSGKFKLKLVFTSTNAENPSPIYKIGENVRFVHDQTRRYLFFGRLVDWVDISNLQYIEKTYGKTFSGYTYK